MKNDIRHHTNYVSVNNVLHRCLMTYLAMFSDMPPAWYIQNVRDSCNRKGYDVPIEDIVKMFTQYKPKWKGTRFHICICEHGGNNCDCGGGN